MMQKGRSGLPLELANQEKMDAASWSALARESRPPHSFSTAICSAVHRPKTSPIPSWSAAAAWGESGPPPLVEADMVLPQGWAFWFTRKFDRREATGAVLRLASQAVAAGG